ncbi:AMP-dependent synthetase/ligase [Bifidobacterium choerinum]|uniref:Acyl-CoA synthetase n=1 Tax=Bifidobacterium choerinum TaxID=35760 RepID=A0A087AED0_9BIFI|nr:AMP-dependent synthetase/ligase [Bifidobacterium choerinum]KFI57130.1 long-chain-fatty acid CoA ligase [Bifidobacterium choerinum]
MLREYGLDNIYVTTQKDTVYSLLSDRAIADPGDLIAQWKDERTRQWNDVMAGEMLAQVRSVAKGLMAIGAKQGTMVVLYSATCYEWGVLDFACAAIGAVSVPIYETDSLKQAASIVEEVDPLIAFGDEAHTHTLDYIAAEHPGLKHVFNLKNGALDALIDYGEAIDDDELDEAIGRVRADDLLTIVFTSGSTGRPKGAMLSHRNFTHIVKNGYEILPEMLYEPNRLLLFLPRVFEKVYNAASQKAGTGMRGRIFANAFKHFVAWSKMEVEHKRPSAVMRMKHSFYMGTVASSFRSALGPNLRYLACGGAPINTDLVHFFNGMDDITFIQGYGMTETAAPMVVNWQKANRPGSVGRPGPGMAIRTAEDGEIEVKGPNVFLGYYRNPDKTDEVLDPSGWLHTGDLGTIDDEGFLYITGRKKDIIITAGGKNVSPAPMEGTICECPIVAHAVVVGDNRPFIGALVTLDPEMTPSWLAEQGLDPRMPMEDVAESDAVHSFIQQYVDRANAEVSRAESVRKFIVLPRDFSLEDGTMTASMKVVRPKVLTRYAEVIDGELYAPVAAVRTPNVGMQILESTTETVKKAGESVRAASENVTPRVRQAIDNVHERLGEWRDEHGDAARERNDDAQPDAGADAKDDADAA